MGTPFLPRTFIGTTDDVGTWSLRLGSTTCEMCLQEAYDRAYDNARVLPAHTSLDYVDRLA